MEDLTSEGQVSIGSEEEGVGRGLEEKENSVKGLESGKGGKGRQGAEEIEENGPRDGSEHKVAITPPETKEMGERKKIPQKSFDFFQLFVYLS